MSSRQYVRSTRRRAHTVLQYIAHVRQKQQQRTDRSNQPGNPSKPKPTSQHSAANGQHVTYRRSPPVLGCSTRETCIASARKQNPGQWHRRMRPETRIQTEENNGEGDGGSSNHKKKTMSVSAQRKKRMNEQGGEKTRAYHTRPGQTTTG